MLQLLHCDAAVSIPLLMSRVLRAHAVIYSSISMKMNYFEFCNKTNICIK